MASHLSLRPAQRISLYDDGEWEEFVLEWATGLSYHQVMRVGGANDHGVDVVGFVSNAGFTGEWDCYQCKHYDRALLPSDALPEILKIILGTMDGFYTWPRQYRFAAPKGYGTTLSNMLHSATELQAAIKKELTKPKSALAKKLGKHSLPSVLDFIESADFDIYGSVELHELVEQHSKTRWHSVRFGLELPIRSAVPEPSEEPTEDEQQYLLALHAAYRERHGGPFDHAQAVASDATRAHYLRQREAFYSAEALRLFARDSVPEGTFSALQQELHDGVVDVHDDQHPDGLERLKQVLQTARSLHLTANGLMPRVEMRDRSGICHQLANANKLKWCHAATE